MSQRGLNVVGDPQDLFGQEESVRSAEYSIGGIINELKGNFCHVHQFWEQKPLFIYTGEVYMSIKWVVRSNLTRRDVLKLETKGYFKQKEPLENGRILAFHNAFANTAENLIASPEFIKLALRKGATSKDVASDPKMLINVTPLSERPMKENLDKILPSVVTIRSGLTHGSGFVISEDGFIITNDHVVGNAKNVAVILNNGLELEGKVVRKKGHRDVALVKVAIRVPSSLPIRSSKIQQLEKIYVIGTPKMEDLRSTITSGIVSAIRHDDRLNLNFIQADAAVSPGNSGGPLLDENGNVVGISVLKVRDAEGLNLFIPINEALKILNIDIAQR